MYLVQVIHLQVGSTGPRSSLHVAFLRCRLPCAVNAVPCLPNLVGMTQSNISMPAYIAVRISSGVPIHITYLGLSSGR